MVQRPQEPEAASMTERIGSFGASPRSARAPPSASRARACPDASTAQRCGPSRSTSCGASRPTANLHALPQGAAVAAGPGEPFHRGLTGVGRVSEVISQWDREECDVSGRAGRTPQPARGCCRTADEKPGPGARRGGREGARYGPGQRTTRCRRSLVPQRCGHVFSPGGGRSGCGARRVSPVGPVVFRGSR